MVVDNYVSYASSLKEARRYLSKHSGLRRVLEDLWKPHELSRMSEVCSSLDYTRSKKKKEVLRKLLIQGLEGAPLEDLPVDDLACLIFIFREIRHGRSIRSKRLILQEIRDNWQKQQGTLTVGQLEDIASLGLKHGSEQVSLLMRQMNSQRPASRLDPRLLDA